VDTNPFPRNDSSRDKDGGFYLEKGSDRAISLFFVAFSAKRLYSAVILKPRSLQDHPVPFPTKLE